MCFQRTCSNEKAGSELTKQICKCFAKIIVFCVQFSCLMFVIYSLSGFDFLMIILALHSPFMFCNHNSFHVSYNHFLLFNFPDYIVELLQICRWFFAQSQKVTKNYFDQVSLAVLCVRKAYADLFCFLFGHAYLSMSVKGKISKSKKHFSSNAFINLANKVIKTNLVLCGK